MTLRPENWSKNSMSEEFEVRGAHEEAMDQAAEHGLPLGQAVALFSAVLATFGAIVSFLGGHTQNEALYYKNEAVLMKARASDAWSYYQAASTKLHLNELAVILAPQRATEFQAQIAKYDRQRQQLESTARQLDRASEQADREAQHALAPHNKLAIAMTFLQIAIALGSITALTRRRWLMWGAGLCGLVGTATAILAWF
jgi:hypothetical protein